MTASATSEPTVAPHWTHQRFVTNLIGASHARELREAALEWRIEKIGTNPTKQHCNICDHAINDYVLVTNQVNGNCLVVGCNCYDKLVQYLRDGSVKSTLLRRQIRVSNLKDYWKRVTLQFPNQTVMGWLEEELAARRITGDMELLVHMVTKLGFAPTTDDADKVVAYYKANRRFLLRTLLLPGQIDSFLHPRLLPKVITINGMERLRGLFVKNAALLAKQRAAEADRGLQDRWRSHRARILDTLKRYDPAHTEIAVGSDLPELIMKLLEVRARLKQILPEKFEGKSHEMEDILFQAREVVIEWIGENKWYFAEPELVLYVARGSHHSPYVLTFEGNRWQRRDTFDAVTPKGRVLGTGLYTARIERYEGAWAGVKTEVYLEKRVEAGDSDFDRLVDIQFTTPSRSRPGTYVGFYDGKVVLPLINLSVPGTRKVFLTNTDGKYYRAWVL